MQQNLAIYIFTIILLYNYEYKYQYNYINIGANWVKILKLKNIVKRNLNLKKKFLNEKLIILIFLKIYKWINNTKLTVINKL